MIFQKIRDWANARNLIKGSTTHAQFVKLVEEIGELAHGIARSNENEIIDSIGDAVVVLTILAEQCGFNIESCIEEAYETIKDRKGKMVDGVFIKDNE